MAIAIVIFFLALSEAKTVAKESSQRALFVEVEIQLKDAYLRTGRFPNSLESLHLTYPDGGDTDLLRDFEYSYTKNSFHLRSTGYHSGAILESRDEH